MFVLSFPFLILLVFVLVLPATSFAESDIEISRAERRWKPLERETKVPDGASQVRLMLFREGIDGALHAAADELDCVDCHDITEGAAGGYPEHGNTLDSGANDQYAEIFFFFDFMLLSILLENKSINL